MAKRFSRKTKKRKSMQKNRRFSRLKFRLYKSKKFIKYL